MFHFSVNTAYHSDTLWCRSLCDGIACLRRVTELGPVSVGISKSEHAADTEPAVVTEAMLEAWDEAFGTWMTIHAEHSFPVVIECCASVPWEAMLHCLGRHIRVLKLVGDGQPSHWRFHPSPPENPMGRCRLEDLTIAVDSSPAVWSALDLLGLGDCPTLATLEVRGGDAIRLPALPGLRQLAIALDIWPEAEEWLANFVAQGGWLRILQLGDRNGVRQQSIWPIEGGQLDLDPVRVPLGLLTTGGHIAVGMPLHVVGIGPPPRLGSVAQRSGMAQILPSDVYVLQTGPDPDEPPSDIPAAILVDRRDQNVVTMPCQGPLLIVHSRCSDRTMRMVTCRKRATRQAFKMFSECSTALAVTIPSFYLSDATCTVHLTRLRRAPLSVKVDLLHTLARRSRRLCRASPLAQFFSLLVAMGESRVPAPVQARVLDTLLALHLPQVSLVLDAAE